MSGAVKWRRGAHGGRLLVGLGSLHAGTLLTSLGEGHVSYSFLPSCVCH